MSSIALMNGSSPQETQNWLKTSVQTFFATCNWDNRSAQVQEVAIAALTQVENIPLTLDLTVSQFFTAVNWEGIALVSQGVPSTLDNPDTNFTAESLDELGFGEQSKGTFTLTDFSDLF